MPRTVQEQIATAVHKQCKTRSTSVCWTRKSFANSTSRARPRSVLPRQIERIREREGVSQAVLARGLNVETKLVGEWETGKKEPSGPSLKLLALVKAKGLDAIA